MPDPCQVDFYVLAGPAPSAGQLACRLSLMAWEQGHRVSVLAADEAAAQALDDLMWEYPPARFLPHERGPADAGVPVQIVLAADQVATDRDVVINLAGSAVPDPTRFRRLLEIVPADEGMRAASREKFRHYRALGLQPDSHAIGQK
jgi:DNA polymerase-3 subunit chi